MSHPNPGTQNLSSPMLSLARSRNGLTFRRTLFVRSRREGISSRETSPRNGAPFIAEIRSNRFAKSITLGVHLKATERGQLLSRPQDASAIRFAGSNFRCSQVVTATLRFADNCSMPRRYTCTPQRSGKVCRAGR